MDAYFLRTVFFSDMTTITPRCDVRISFVSLWDVGENYDSVCDDIIATIEMILEGNANVLRGSVCIEHD